MKIFISGGCKNGKSYYAQYLAKLQQDKNNGRLYYIATMNSSDHEDDQRIRRHQKERDGWGFTTVEQWTNIESILNLCDHKGSFLLDSLTALLANEMFTPDGAIHTNASEKIIAGLSKVMSSINNIVIVSDYIYSDGILYDPLTEEYKKSLAALDLFVAKQCDVVIEVCYGQIIIHKESLQGVTLFPNHLAPQQILQGGLNETFEKLY
jgi:adenosylcobinamide kinase/adenosylcobinamide-phosphate guanylyltransferase